MNKFGLAFVAIILIVAFWPEKYACFGGQNCVEFNDVNLSEEAVDEVAMICLEIDKTPIGDKTEVLPRVYFEIEYMFEWGVSVPIPEDNGDLRAWKHNAINTCRQFNKTVMNGYSPF
jgi:hypothetical protein